MRFLTEHDVACAYENDIEVIRATNVSNPVAVRGLSWRTKAENLGLTCPWGQASLGRSMADARTCLSFVARTYAGQQR